MTGKQKGFGETWSQKISFFFLKLATRTCGWWKKSCTSWYGKFPNFIHPRCCRISPINRSNPNHNSHYSENNPSLEPVVWYIFYQRVGMEALLGKDQRYSGHQNQASRVVPTHLWNTPLDFPTACKRILILVREIAYSVLCGRVVTFLGITRFSLPQVFLEFNFSVVMEDSPDFLALTSFHIFTVVVILAQHGI